MGYFIIKRFHRYDCPGCGRIVSQLPVKGRITCPNCGTSWKISQGV